VRMRGGGRRRWRLQGSHTWKWSVEGPHPSFLWFNSLGNC
jgi:hypothetical protein